MNMQSPSTRTAILIGRTASLSVSAVEGEDSTLGDRLPFRSEEYRIAMAFSKTDRSSQVGI
jgi:hypothetical protein